MTTPIIVFILIFTVLLIAIIVTIKNRNKAESKISVDEHPTTFKKPDIEMVNSSPEQNKESTTLYEAKPKDNDDKE